MVASSSVYQAGYDKGSVAISVDYPGTFIAQYVPYTVQTPSFTTEPFNITGT